MCFYEKVSHENRLKQRMFKVCKKEQEQVKQTTDNYLRFFVADL